MKSLIVYDSNFGNTKLIADEVARNLDGDARTIHVKDFYLMDLAGVDLIVIGSPINGWRATEKMMVTLEAFSESSFKGIKFTTFDTRVKFFLHGDAKDKLAEVIASKGGKLVIEPKEFYVTGREGPLVEGEIEKAADWANQIKGKF